MHKALFRTLNPTFYLIKHLDPSILWHISAVIRFKYANTPVA